LPAERRALASLVATRAPARLAPPKGEWDGAHPLLVELWNVRDGAVQLGVTDQHEVFARVGSIWGGLAGALFGAPFGMDPACGYLAASRAAGRRASAWSRDLARAAGEYSELMISVPHVLLDEAREHGPHSLVVAMATDGALARWADRALGFGYGKERARFRADSTGRWSVERGGGPSLAVQCRLPRRPHPPVDARPLDALFDLPLVGVAAGGRLVRSRLHRSFSGERTSATPVAASLHQSSPWLGAALRDFEDIPPYPGPGREPWGALLFSRLRATVSYPSPL
jgi:hypothetical protein